MGGGGKFRNLEKGCTQLSTPETLGRLSTSIRYLDIWDHLGNFRELQMVDSYLGNHGPIITQASYPNDPINQITER